MNMKTPTLNLYDFIGVIVPGTVLLVGVSILFDLGPIDSLLVPQDFGSLTVHLVFAYVTGQLIQAIGNVVEIVYWSLWKGNPTDWPVSNPARNRFSSAVETACRLIGENKPEGTDKERRHQWKRMTLLAQSNIYAEEMAGRLEVFNRLYGMFRGVFASVLVLALLGWKSSQVDLWTLYILLCAIVVTALYRMHHFAVCYAFELFSSVVYLLEKAKSSSKPTFRTLRME
jgi:hypothetical protein